MKHNLNIDLLEEQEMNQQLEEAEAI